MGPRTRSQGNVESSVNERNRISYKPTDSDNDERSDDDLDEREKYIFDGKEYKTYSDMVDAKRKRNRDVMVKSGLIEAHAILKEATSTRATNRGLQRKRKSTVPKMPRRKSSRLAGVAADNIFVENERSGKFTISGNPAQASRTLSVEVKKNFKDRINDGSDLMLEQTLGLLSPKWVQEDTLSLTQDFFRSVLNARYAGGKKTSSTGSPTSVVSLIPSSLPALSADDIENVAKVTPERIYSVACHPSRDCLIVAAGDKQGHVGLWHVDARSSQNDGVYLVKPHCRPVSNLEWTDSGDAFMSSSYDGTVRWFDARAQKFVQVFATYDDSAAHEKELGHGLDKGYNYWVQFCTGDHRNSSEKCFFLSTSAGTAMHVDLRVGKKRLTFHETLSEKKINSLSLHPNGTTLASAGLDCTVRLWDVRQLRNNRSSSSKRRSALATQRCSKSINSAFFSPSGSSLLSTTMANTLELVDDPHLVKNVYEPTKRVRHDNMTGRWLSTFMAKWHPEEDVFVVGSMLRPRTIEVFDSQGLLLHGIKGEALTAVASRCCFHPSPDRLVVVGGNSSGRVTVAR